MPGIGLTRECLGDTNWTSWFGERDDKDRDRMRMRLGGQGGEEEKEGLKGDYDLKKNDSSNNKAFLKKKRIGSWRAGLESKSAGCSLHGS